eukprot:811813-Rhodomonas_salina.1
MPHLSTAHPKARIAAYAISVPHTQLLAERSLSQYGTPQGTCVAPCPVSAPLSSTRIMAR